MTDTLRIAALQMVTEIAHSEVEVSAVIQRNLETATRLTREASVLGSEMVVLPENVLSFGTRARFSREQQQQWLCAFSALAAEHGLWLVAGSLPLENFTSDGDVYAPLAWLDNESPHSGKPFATCPVFDGDGVLQGCYRKMHLFDAEVDDGTGVYRESDHFRAGDTPGVVATPWGTMGVGICYDLRFPEYFRALRAQDVQLAVLPSAFTWATGKAHWELLLRARAVENQMIIVGVNQGGEHSASRKTWGDSMVVDSWGGVVARVGEQPPVKDSQLGEAVLIADLDFAALRNTRVKMPVWQHRRL